MILVLSDLWVPFPGGAERLIFNISRDLMRRGHDVRVLTDYAACMQFDGPPTGWKPLEHVPHDEAWVMIQDEIDRLKPDVILTHHYFAYLFETELAACSVPFVQIVLNTRRIETAAFAVHITDWVRAAVGGWWPEDMMIRPPAFEDVIAPEHDDAVGFIKPLPHKGVELVYQIAERLPDRKFIILRGEWQDIEIIRELPNVEFMEPVVDIREFYARCRLVLMPSLSEDAGTVAQECAVNGIPCISSNVQGLRETNAGGTQLDPQDLDGWVHEIEVLLDDELMYAAIAGSQCYQLGGQERELAELSERMKTFT